MDLLERLRQKATLGYSSICLEAADEIERLRREVEEWKKRCLDLVNSRIDWPPPIVDGPTSDN